MRLVLSFDEVVKACREYAANYYDFKSDSTHDDPRVFCIDSDGLELSEDDCVGNVFGVDIELRSKEGAV